MRSRKSNAFQDFSPIYIALYWKQLLFAMTPKQVAIYKFTAFSLPREEFHGFFYERVLKVELFMAFQEKYIFFKSQIGAYGYSFCLSFV